MDDTEQDKIFEEVEAKHGSCEWFSFADGQLVAVTKPQSAHIEYKRFVDAAADNKASKGEAQETLVLSCVVYPEDRAQARRVLQTWPSSLGEMASACTELMAGGVKRLGKAPKKQNTTT
jgi:hypothetical protein